MIISAIKKPTIVIISIICILLITLSAIVESTGAYAVYFNGTVKKVPIYSVDRKDNKISISFDCAYGADYTEKLLEILQEYDVKCTFYMVEFWVKKFPDMVKKIHDAGHEIGTHSKTHPKMSTLSESEIKDELLSSIKAIENITGQKVETFRPPFGDYDDLLLDVATSLGLYTIQWDVDSIDWKDITAEQIIKRVVSKTKSGSIILCHNNGRYTAKALPYILSNLKEKGFEFVKINELIYKENYKINSFGVQIKNE